MNNISAVAAFLVTAGIVSPAAAARLECVPNASLQWGETSALVPIPEDQRGIAYTTTVDTETGGYLQQSLELAQLMEGTLTVVHAGSLEGPVDFVAVDARNGMRLQIAIWHTPVTFLLADLDDTVWTGVCTERP